MAESHELEREAEQLRDDGKYDEAIEKLNQLIQSDETFVRAHLALAVLYGRVDQHEQAIVHGERACELEPNDTFNFTAMSVVYRRAFEGTDNQKYIDLAEQAMDRSRM